MRRSVLVVGGGIAGLTYAVAVSRAGDAVEVIEARPDWSVAGWGLSLTGPALRALRTLGLDVPCEREGAGIFVTRHCDAVGEVMHVLETPSLLGPGRPVEVGLGRPALHRILREAAADSGAVLRTGLTVEAYDGKVARLSDGSVREPGFLVGADGVRSRTRRQLGVDGEPRYTGQMVWRALVERPSWSEGVHTFAGPTGTTGVLPISETEAYVFLTQDVDEPDTIPDAELAGRMRELLAGFGGRFAPVRETIVRPSQVVRRPVYSLMVDGPWHGNGGVLIGDAVHAPSPQMVSGAALAIEDAVVLASETTRHDDVESAFTAYEDRRRSRARAVVETSLEIGRQERAGNRRAVAELQQKGHAGMVAPI